MGMTGFSVVKASFSIIRVPRAASSTQVFQQELARHAGAYTRDPVLCGLHFQTIVMEKGALYSMKSGRYQEMTWPQDELRMEALLA